MGGGLVVSLDLLQREAQRLQVTLSPAQLIQLKAYVRLLQRDGDLLGLTSLRSEEDILRELVIDPLAGADLFDPDATVLDVGSGGGCPGLALAVARPDLRITLLESKQRKANFLRRAGAELGLTVGVMSDRAEILARQIAHRECYDHATAKALAAMPVLLELTLPFVRLGGSLVAYKGPGLQAELEKSTRALELLGGAVASVRPYELADRRYQLCVVRKLRATGTAYPRQAGTPARAPL